MYVPQKKSLTISKLGPLAYLPLVPLYSQLSLVTKSREVPKRGNIVSPLSAAAKMFLSQRAAPTCTGAPEERVSGQFLDKDRIKRGQSEVKVRIYPYFIHPLSLPSLYLPIHLTFSSVHPTQCPYPEFIHSLSSVWSSNIPQTFSSSWWQSWKLWITAFVCELQCKCWLYPQFNRALT